MTHNDPAVSASDEDRANAAREALYYYNVYLNHLVFDLLVMFDEDKIEPIEQAKADVVFAVARFRVAVDSAVFKGDLLLRETEIGKIVAIAEKYGVDEECITRIPGLFTRIYSCAERVANKLTDVPESKK